MRVGPGGANINREGLVPASYVAEVIEQSAPKLSQRAAPPPPVPEPHVMEIKNVAVEHAECAICYDEMVVRPSCVLINSGNKRSCRHFLHKECAQNLLSANQRLCPICRAPFSGVADVPAFDNNPKRWFDTVDANGDGTLSKAEVIEIMKATMSIDYRALEKNVDKLWPSGTRMDQVKLISGSCATRKLDFSSMFEGTSHGCSVRRLRS